VPKPVEMAVQEAATQVLNRPEPEQPIKDTLLLLEAAAALEELELETTVALEFHLLLQPLLYQEAAAAEAKVEVDLTAEETEVLILLAQGQRELQTQAAAAAVAVAAGLLMVQTEARG
jgi:hypothetical protein